MKKFIVTAFVLGLLAVGAVTGSTSIAMDELPEITSKDVQ